MPCVLASNVRYVSAQDQERLTGKQRRQLALSRLSEGTKRECKEVMKSRGQSFLMPIKLPLKIKPEFHQYVKSKTRTLTPKEQERLRNAAKIVTIEERLDALAKQDELTKLKTEQAERSKLYFRRIDDEKAKAAAVQSAKEDEESMGDSAKQKTMELAFIAKQEQEEEVRAVNRFILHAKCQAIRDIQIKEKKDIERKQTEEKIRLERMVINENAKALALEDSFALKRKERGAKYAEEIRQQLLQRQTLRLMEAERAEDEGRMAREANAARQREEEQLAQLARNRREHFRYELDHIVEVSNLFKKMLCEQEREADRRVAEYAKEKRAREEQLKREKQLARENFERKQEMLYQLAKKLMSSKSEREEFNLLREQERAERDYRRREKESAIRRKKLEDDIKGARQRQMEEARTRQALQIAREENSFKEMIASLKKDEEQVKKQEEERERRRHLYRAEITKQMKDKAEIHRRLLENERKETIIWREAERKRLANVRAVVGAKLSAMRDACLPEHYIKDIERMMERIIKRNPTQKQS